MSHDHIHSDHNCHDHHEHHHEHDHAHEHHHNHADGQIDYENPTVISFSREFKIKDKSLGVKDISERLGQILLDISQEVRNKNGLVGHIKSFISFKEGGSLGLSVVRDSVRYNDQDFKAETSTCCFSIALTAIVYGCPESEIARMLNFGLTKSLPNFLFEETTSQN